MGMKRFDDDASFEWFFNAVVTMGKASVPVNMLILGSSLSNIPSFSSIHWRSTVVVACSKLLVHPALCFGLMFGLHSCGALRRLVGDDSVRPEFVIVACILTATPTANNLTVMAELSAGKEAKKALASMIFVMYCLAPLALTGWIVFPVIGKGRGCSLAFPVTGICIYCSFPRASSSHGAVSW